MNAPGLKTWATALELHSSPGEYPQVAARHFGWRRDAKHAEQRGRNILQCAIATQLYGVEPTDAVALGGAAALLILIGMAASWIPSRRAAMLDPIRALREE